jgi:hypothetical protein
VHNSPGAGMSVMQTLDASDEEEMQIVMDMLSKCKRDCKIEVPCVICLSEKLSILRIK